MTTPNQEPIAQIEIVIDNEQKILNSMLDDKKVIVEELSELVKDQKQKNTPKIEILTTKKKKKKKKKKRKRKKKEKENETENETGETSKSMEPTELRLQLIELKIQLQKTKILLLQRQVTQIKTGQFETETLNTNKLLTEVYKNKKIIKLQGRIIKLEFEILSMDDNDVLQLSDKTEFSKLAQLRRNLASAFKEKKKRKIEKKEKKEKKEELPQKTIKINFDPKQSVRRYIAVTTNRILKRNELNNSHRQEVLLSIENYLFPQVISILIQDIHKKEHEKDQNLNSKFVKYQNIAQEQLHIPEKLRSKELIPFVDAIAYMRSVQYATTPTSKLYAILNSAQAIFNQVGKTAPGKIVGADEHLTYIKYFCDEALLNTELGYYLVSLDLSTAFIEKMTDEKLSNLSIDILNKQVVFFQRVKFIEMAQKMPYLGLVSEEVILKGYKLIIVVDWFLNLSRFYSTFLLKTGKKTDLVKGSLIKFNLNITGNQQSFLVKKFFQSDIESIKMKQVEKKILCNENK
ncbi:rab5 gdp/gtp exchange factor [Anaeramoeba flamelloides]|uniref:Rab5 gdp/gtp exchange factor n=1 Tax=Anaeramoeba flamelloides TaxID=1746091 RepID=A0AAV7YZY5_9EUKA|nr:rab5 gdp/gtp exchange factor [Anaeramoeba flamelloides]